MAKPLLEQAAIYDAAVALVNEAGAEQFSVRQLTQRLGCSPNTIYAQVGDREALISGMLAHFFSSQPIQLDASASWQAQCVEWAHRVHDMLVAHPELAKMISWRQRPLIVSWVSELLRVLLSAGFEPEPALRCVRVLSHQTISLALMEIDSPSESIRRQRRSRPERALERLAKEAIDPSGVASDNWELHTQREIFSSAIEFTVAGIASSMAPAD